MMRRAFRSYRGQALTEFVVALAAIAPLFLLVPLLGKLIDILQTTEIASRYVAFEAVARDPLHGYLLDDQLRAELNTRIFSRTDAPMRSIAADEAPADSVRNPLWVDHRGDNLILTSSDAVFARTNVTIKDPFRFARAWWSSGLKLRDRSFVLGSARAQVVSMDTQRKAAEARALDVTRKTALLVEDWSALDTDDLRRRIENGGVQIFPAAKGDRILDFAGKLPQLLTDEPLDFGLRDWEVVPCDRIRGGCDP
jgi:hypothetical protein